MLAFPQSSLTYVGGRPYIRGADLFGLFDRQVAAHADAALRPVSYRAFRLVAEVRRDGCWHLTDEGDVLPGPASATLDYVGGDGVERRAAFVETGAEITAASPNIGSFVVSARTTGEFAGEAEFRPMNGADDLMNALIEVNKKVHADTLTARNLPTDAIRLVYMENFPPLAGATRVAISHLGARSARQRTYTLNRAAVESETGSFEITICFSC